MAFGKQLAHVDKRTRDGAVDAVIQWLRTQDFEGSPENEKVAELSYLKLWKGLYYCFWMSDKPHIQKHLAEKLASIPLQLSWSQALLFLKTLWMTLIREWHGIDRLRLDKFYMFLREIYKTQFLMINHFTSCDISQNHGKMESEKAVEQMLEFIKDCTPLNSTDPSKGALGLKYHFTEAFLDALEAADMSEQKFLTVFYDILEKTEHTVWAKRVLDEVFDRILKNQESKFNKIEIVQKLVEIKNKGTCCQPKELADLIQAFQKAGFGVTAEENKKENKKSKALENLLHNLERAEKLKKDEELKEQLEKKSIATVSDTESQEAEEDTEVKLIVDIPTPVSVASELNAEDIQNEAPSKSSKKRKRSKKNKDKEKSVALFVAEQDTPPQSANETEKIEENQDSPATKKRKSVQWKADNQVKKFNKKLAIALPFSKVKVENKSPLKSALKKRD